jgi:translation initiation factor 2B subunit (eIF-2B alpha/beta/delta family)
MVQQLHGFLLFFRHSRLDSELRNYAAYLPKGGENALSSEFVIERMTNKLEELGQDIARVCATRDRLIEGIDDAKARARNRQESGVQQHVQQPTVPI